MASNHLNVTVNVKVRISPAGLRPTVWGRIKLALWILAGRPVLFDFRSVVDP